MPWASNSPRRRRLPRDWARIRARILQRDPVCYIQGPTCTQQSTEVDHLQAMTDDHADHMLRGCCRACHALKSAAEGGRAAQQARPKRKRQPEAHPGLLPPPTQTPPG